MATLRRYANVVGKGVSFTHDPLQHNKSESSETLRIGLKVCNDEDAKSKSIFLA